MAEKISLIQGKDKIPDQAHAEIQSILEGRTDNEEASLWQKLLVIVIFISLTSYGMVAVSFQHQEDAAFYYWYQQGQNKRVYKGETDAWWFWKKMQEEKARNAPKNQHPKIFLIF